MAQTTPTKRNDIREIPVMGLRPPRRMRRKSDPRPIAGKEMMSAYGIRGPILAKLARNGGDRIVGKIRPEEAGGYLQSTGDSMAQEDANRRKSPALGHKKVPPKSPPKASNPNIVAPNNTSIDGKTGGKGKPFPPPGQPQWIWKQKARAAGSASAEPEQRPTLMGQGIARKFGPELGRISF